MMPMSAEEAPLETYRWAKRVLLVFAPDADSALYQRQQEMLLVGEHGLNERDMVVILVITSAVSLKEKPAARVSAVELRDAYGVLPHEFQVVLIGKDGGVKLRQEEPISLADLCALIDSMPMRKQEMRQGSR
jgi:hypothetical protein